MRSLLAWTLWFLTFMFPVGITFLARQGGKKEVLWWPLLLFYGAALASTLLALLFARAWFRHVPISLNVRRTIVQIIFIVPLIPSLVYIGLLITRLMHGG